MSDYWVRQRSRRRTICWPCSARWSRRKRPRSVNPLPYRSPAGDPMQRLPLGVINADPALVLPRPIGPHDLLIRAVADLNDGAILRGRPHVAENFTAHGTPYHVEVISFQ